MIFMLSTEIQQVLVKTTPNVRVSVSYGWLLTSVFCVLVHAAKESPKELTFYS